MAHYCLSVVTIFDCLSRKNWVIESVINRVAVKLSLGMPLPPEKNLHCLLADLTLRTVCRKLTNYFHVGLLQPDGAGPEPVDLEEDQDFEEFATLESDARPGQEEDDSDNTDAT